MTTTETITTPTAPKKRRRKLIIGTAIGAAIIFAFVIGKTGGGSADAAAPAPTPAPVTITEHAVAPAPITVTAPAPPPVTVTAPAPSPVSVTVTAPPPAAAPAPAPVVPAGPAAEITKSGTYVAGANIQPGKWVTDGKINPAKSVGYFAVLADPTGSTSDVNNILTNDNPDGQAFVTVGYGQGLESNNLHWTWLG